MLKFYLRVELEVDLKRYEENLFVFLVLIVDICIVYMYIVLYLV